MQSYRTPGPSQATSLWVNELLLDRVRGGGLVLLEISLDISVQVNEAQTIAPFSSKIVRLMAENAALLAERQGGWSILNKET